MEAHHIPLGSIPNIQDFRKTSQYGSCKKSKDCKSEYCLISEKLVSMEDDFCFYFPCLLLTQFQKNQLVWKNVFFHYLSQHVRPISEKLVSMEGFALRKFMASMQSQNFRKTSQYGSVQIEINSSHLSHHQDFRKPSQYGST